MGKPEAQVENYLLSQALQHQCLCYKFTSPGTRGVPDRIIIGKGHTVFVETKSEVGTLRKQQEFRINDMRKHGADVRVLNTRQAVDDFFIETNNW